MWPEGGLANRIRVLAFCHQLAEKHQCQLVCCWEINEGLSAHFESLFKPTNFIVENVCGHNYLLKRYCNWWPHIRIMYKCIKRYVWLKIHRVDKWIPSDYVDEIISINNGKQMLCDMIEKNISVGKTVFLATCEDFGEYNISFLNPVDSIMEMIKEWLTLFDQGHNYGLHIRRSDNDKSIEYSPIELFEKVIDSIITKDTLSKFYLATDDSKTAEYLCSKYGNHIVYREKELSRKTENGIREALIDMWMLGYMDSIYGSYWSSFSVVASWINSRPYHCLKKINI